MTSLSTWIPPQSDTPTKFAGFEGWRDISGMSRSRSYIEIAKGNLRAIKVGRRTLIDVDHGLAWLRSLPDAASIRPARA